MKINQIFRSLCKVSLLLVTVLFSCADQEEEQIAKSVSTQDKFHTITIDDNTMKIKESDGVYYFADDVILTEKQFNLLKHYSNKNLSTEERSTVTRNFQSLWPNNTVFYKLSLGVDNQHALSAMQRIASVTNLRFVERTTQRNYIEFVRSTGNNSPLGMTGSRQVLNLFNTNHQGVIMHEMLHAIGIHHEQCRPDRDNSVIINFANIPDNLEHNFNKAPGFLGHGQFDFNSIMMYEAFAFSSNGLPTITRRNGTTYTSQINQLSAGDIAGINFLYPRR